MYDVPKIPYSVVSRQFGLLTAKTFRKSPAIPLGSGFCHA